MALLTVAQRKQYFKELGLGAYNKENILKFQKKYIGYSKYCDGIYGTNTDNTLRTVYNVKKYTKNFSPSEFKCECGGRYCCGYPSYMKPTQLTNLQTIRTHYGKSMTITSGMRCKGYNSAIGGSITNSKHLVGQATDFYVAGVTDTLANRKAFIRYAKNLPNTTYIYGNGINSYGSYISAPYMGNAIHYDTANASVSTTTTKTTTTAAATKSNGKLTVDGVGGTATVKAMQKFFGIGQDGIISGQNLSLQKKYYPSLTAVKVGTGGSATIKQLQRWVGVSQDGVLGPGTIKAWQKKIGVTADGVFGTNSMKAWQKYLNTHSKPTYPKQTTTKVIDISEFQSTINFAKVKADGIEGVIVRCGYRGAEKGTLNEDSRFIEHIKGAYKAGLAVGIYMFTEGITAAEGKAEADYAIKMWKKAGIPLSYPIAIDTEAVNIKNERAKNLTRAQRTAVIKGFCDRIKELGYEPMIYASTAWLNNKLDMSRLPYKVWVAQYNSTCEYKGSYVMWQYTSSASVSGVGGKVDMNKCYIAAKPYNYIAPKVATKQDKMLAWAKKIAADKYHYVYWKENVAKTHSCPICNGRKYDDYYGGNCIWFAWASWHHGGGLASKCNCCVFTDYHYNQLLKLSTAEALKLAKSRIGLNDIQLLRSSSGLSLSQLKAGDVIAYFNGSGYVHTALYIGNGQIADCTSERSDGIKYGVPSYSNWKIKLAFRYTGK